MKAGKIIAVTFFALWTVGIGAMVILRPYAQRSKTLMKAAQAGDDATVKSMLESGASVSVRDRDGHTPLWLAAYYNRLGSALMLLKAGADPNARGADGWTPIMWASVNGHVDMVKLLVEWKADVNREGNVGETALSYAISYKHPDVAEVLKRAGALK